MSRRMSAKRAQSGARMRGENRRKPYFWIS
jgi:hypothetical protein